MSALAAPTASASMIAKPWQSYGVGQAIAPKQIAVDTQSNLWILQATDASNPPKILHYSKTGSLSSQKITDIVDPTALAINPQGRLLVTENGPRQQVLIYDISGTPKLIGTFGTQGGIYSGTRGEVGELKLNGL